MTITDRAAGNDVRGLLLVHDRIRAVVPEAARHVRALRPGDRRGARAAVRAWAGFARAVQRHHQAADADLWPLVLGLVPELAGEVQRLRAERARLDADLAAVAAGLEQSARPGGSGSTAAAALARLDTQLRRHLAAEEQLVLPVLRHRVPAERWAAVEPALVERAAVLGTAFAPQPEPARAGFLRRRPAPVHGRLCLVPGPRHRRPLVTAATR